MYEYVCMSYLPYIIFFKKEKAHEHYNDIMRIYISIKSQKI